MQVCYLDRQFVALELQAEEAFLEARVLCFHQPLLDEGEQACQGGLRIAMGLAQPVDLMLVPVRPFARGLQVGIEQGAQAVWIKHMLDDLADDDLVKAVHAHADTPAGKRPFLELP